MARPGPLIVGIGEVLWDMLPGGKQLGGAPANFAYHANALGARGAVVSRVGNDDFGREILVRLRDLGLDAAHVSIDPERPTGTVDVRVDAEGVPEYVIHFPVAWDALVADASALEFLGGAAAVCYGTLASRNEASARAVASFVSAAGRGRCLRVFDINLRQNYYSADLVDDLLTETDVLKLNESELPVVSRLLRLGTVEPADAARLLVDWFDLRLVALTRGPHGSALFARDGGESDHPGASVGPVADTVGAGDAFTAALVMGLL